MNYGKQILAKRKREKIAVVVALLVAIVFFLQIPTHVFGYDRESTLLQHAYSHGGCAMSVNCPEAWQEEEKYYALYEFDSKEYWHAYCGQLSGTNFACK